MRCGHDSLAAPPGARFARPQASGRERSCEVFGMNCSNNQSGLTELARGSRMDARQRDELRAHMRECSHCQREFDAQVRLSEAMAALSADASLTIPPPEVEAALLAEFDRTLKPHAVYGFTRLWYAGAAIAACLLLAWGLWPTGRRQPVPQAVKNSVPA